MRDLRTFVWGILIIGTAGIARADAQQPVASDTMAVMLPVGTFTADVMELYPSPRMAELSQRLQAGVRANPEWFQKAVRNAAPGEPIPYDARMGLSEAEWEEFLEISLHQSLRKVAEGPLTVRVDGTRLVLDGGDAFPELTGVAIDRAADEVVTPELVIRGSRPVHNDGEAGAIGAWDGRAWEMESGSVDAGDIKTVSLRLGRIRETGRGLLMWEDAVIVRGVLVRRADLVLYFELPTESATPPIPGP